MLSRLLTSARLEWEQQCSSHKLRAQPCRRPWAWAQMREMSVPTVTTDCGHHGLFTANTACSCRVLGRHKRATTIQKWVRMHQQRGRYRRETEAGRRAAARAASAARQDAAATVLQKHARRWHARRKVGQHVVLSGAL